MVAADSQVKKKRRRKKKKIIKKTTTYDRLVFGRSKPRAGSVEAKDLVGNGVVPTVVPVGNVLLAHCALRRRELVPGIRMCASEREHERGTTKASEAHRNGHSFPRLHVPLMKNVQMCARFRLYVGSDRAIALSISLPADEARIESSDWGTVEEPPSASWRSMF